MNDNRQYLVVGLFVVITTTILVSVWLWFSVNSHQAYNTYITIFHEPVDGINNSSIIKYNGVEVGKVKQIELDSKNPRNIHVYLNILQNIAIISDTYATIKPQGITGLSYIELVSPRESSAAAEIIKPHNTPPYPQIMSKPSLFYNLSQQAQSLTSNVQDISMQMKVMLNDQNLEHLANTLKNLDRISTTIANRSNQIGKSLDLLSDILGNVKRNTENLNSTFKDIAGLTHLLSSTTQNANDLILNLQNNTLQNVDTILLPNLNKTIMHLNQSSYQLEQFLTLLNQNPSALVRGKLPPKPGPGE